jgi:putative transposase
MGMSKLRRYFHPGQIYFVTSVAYQRLPIFLENSDLLLAAFKSVFSGSNSELLAWVILPEHFHIVVDPKTILLSEQMHRLKMLFAGGYRMRARVYSGRLWQHRYWDHIIRDDSDLERHINYIYYNPVKHGLATVPEDYETSSFSDLSIDEARAIDWDEVSKMEIDEHFGE